MDRGFFPPESDEDLMQPSKDEFLGEFGERDQARTEVDPLNPRIEIEEETGEIRPL